MFLGKENINILFRSKYIEYMGPSSSKFEHISRIRKSNSSEFQSLTSQTTIGSSDVRKSNPVI